MKIIGEEDFTSQKSKIQKREHHALPYVELPAFMALLCQQEEIAAAALRL